MNTTLNKSAIKAILFAYGDSIDRSLLASSSEIDISDLDNIIFEINKEYDENKQPFHILKLGNSYQLSTKKEFSHYIKNAMDSKKNTPLSSAAMEVLTIIAYNQLVSKSFVSHVRGIESGSIVNNLAERELIEEAGRLDVPGKPVAYKTTDNFLRCFNISSLDELIPLPENISDNNQSLSDNNNEE